MREQNKCVEIHKKKKIVDIVLKCILHGLKFK